MSRNLLEFSSVNYYSKENLQINRQVEDIEVIGATDRILQGIDTRKGVLFSSSYDYPGRYTQWDIGFLNPCLELRAQGRTFEIAALKTKGLMLLELIFSKLSNLPELEQIEKTVNSLRASLLESEEIFAEENRSRQATIFTVIRAIREIFASDEERFLGLYGAFGYDLVFQFEAIKLKQQRSKQEYDLVLYLPDELTVVDHRRGRAYRLKYDFAVENNSTGEFYGISTPTPTDKQITEELPELQKGKYAEKVRKASEYFGRGDLFEVVPSHTLYEPCIYPPAQVFEKLKAINPSPYGFIINLGHEFLVGASPEMYVRVEGKRVETCPISGTIKRGKDAIEDAVQIRKLLNSFKDEAELTMCTDVDRNDKSRICQPGSVKVIGRRQIEMYSQLIHTVDHVEGMLRSEFDSLDAFLTHMWAVTVTGAPKRAAVKWLEENEDSPRGWYGGAVGYLSFNGDLNTGLTLRTIRIRNKVAEIRVGATLLYDSIPEDEENETLLKAAALVKAIRSCGATAKQNHKPKNKTMPGKKVLLVDHEDSFVHTLANYFRQSGADVRVLRAPLARKALSAGQIYDLLVLSPGPGRPAEFELNQTIELALERGLPLFGVCLGMQGIVEYFGGSLGQLCYPQHGKSAQLKICQTSPLWEGLPAEIKVGRYHSLYAEEVPECLEVTAKSEDGVVMAVEHKNLPIAALQFHPESIMTAQGDFGLRILQNVINQL
ncbi:MAG: anthranilate synthase component I [Syntrophomonadaceae bacterium]|nr:anthranilate synthase component I [Syntrophomonadaceae bacterium]